MSTREQTDSVPLSTGGGLPSKQKQEQVLIINPPHELVFTGPFREPVSSVMTLTNPSDKKVLFKIKTTAPQQYSVKPNLGVVYPNETVKIAVNLQPFDYDPEKKCRHKFMVQSMFASNKDTANFEPLLMWKDMDSSQLMDSKLRCLFVIPGSDVNGSGGGGFESNGNKEANPVSAASSIAGSDYLTIDANKAGDQLIPTAPKNLTAAMSKANTGESSNLKKCGEESRRYQEDDLKKSVEEIRRLQEEISQLRHDNVELKEEAIRARRRAERTESMISASSGSCSTSDGYTVNAMNPDANALSVTYIYIALIILVVGIILGKVIF